MKVFTLLKRIIIIRGGDLHQINRKRHFNTRSAQTQLSCGGNMTKSVLALLATGTEEMELVIVVDILRRAGVSTTNFALIDLQTFITPFPF